MAIAPTPAGVAMAAMVVSFIIVCSVTRQNRVEVSIQFYHQTVPTF